MVYLHNFNKFDTYINIGVHYTLFIFYIWYGNRTNLFLYNIKMLLSNLLIPIFPIDKDETVSNV